MTFLHPVKTSSFFYTLRPKLQNTLHLKCRRIIILEEKCGPVADYGDPSIGVHLDKHKRENQFKPNIGVVRSLSFLWIDIFHSCLVLINLRIIHPYACCKKNEKCKSKRNTHFLI